MRKKSTQGREAKAVLVSCTSIWYLEYSKVLGEDVNGERVQDTAFVF